MHPAALSQPVFKDPMKKTFELTHPKIKYLRMVDSVKNDVRKYIKRERRKELPEGGDFWDFDCKFGDTEAEAQAIHLSEIDKKINDITARKLTAFYIEILAKPGVRTKKPQAGDTPQPLEIKGFGKGASGETV